MIHKSWPNHVSIMPKPLKQLKHTAPSFIPVKPSIPHSNQTTWDKDGIDCLLPSVNRIDRTPFHADNRTCTRQVTLAVPSKPQVYKKTTCHHFHRKDPSPHHANTFLSAAPTSTMSSSTNQIFHKKTKKLFPTPDTTCHNQSCYSQSQRSNLALKQNHHNPAQTCNQPTKIRKAISFRWAIPLTHATSLSYEIQKLCLPHHHLPNITTAY